MKFVIIESPFATRTLTMPDGTELVMSREDNVAYARACMHDCLVNRNEAPYASHLLYTQPGVLDDDVPEERELGIQAGFEFGPFAYRRVFFLDRGFSSGMAKALEHAEELKYRCEARFLGGDWATGWEPDPELVRRIERCGVPQARR